MKPRFGFGKSRYLSPNTIVFEPAEHAFRSGSGTAPQYAHRRWLVLVTAAVAGGLLLLLAMMMIAAPAKRLAMIAPANTPPWPSPLIFFLVRATLALRRKSV